MINNFSSDSLKIICIKCNKISTFIYKCKTNHINCENCVKLSGFLCFLCKENCILNKSDDKDINDTPVICKSCGYETIYSEMQEHYKICEKIEKSCESCGFFILLSENEQHKTKCHIRWKQECPFGCNTSGFSETDLKKHRIEKFPYHIDIVYSILKYFGLDKVQNVKGDIDNITKSKETFEFYEVLMNDEINDIVDYLNLTKEIDQLRKKIYMKLIEKKEQMRLLEKAIDVALITSFNGTLTWIIEELSIIDIILNSPIFYTGKYGYKLQLQIEKKDEQQNIFLLFLEGMYDPILRPVFDTKIDLEYKIKKQEKYLFDKEDKRLDRNGGKILIKSISSELIIEWIKFSLDCSEFDFPSID